MKTEERTGTNVLVLLLLLVERGEQTEGEAVQGGGEQGGAGRHTKTRNTNNTNDSIDMVIFMFMFARCEANKRDVEHVTSDM